MFEEIIFSLCINRGDFNKFSVRITADQRTKKKNTKQLWQQLTEHEWDNNWNNNTQNEYQTNSQILNSVLKKHYDKSEIILDWMVCLVVFVCISRCIMIETR